MKSKFWEKVKEKHPGPNNWPDQSVYGCEDCNDGVPEAVPPGSPVSLAPFFHDDIKRLFHENRGGRDESALLVGELNDGRFFAASSWEDYSGHG